MSPSPSSSAHAFADAGADSGAVEVRQRVHGRQVHGLDEHEADTALLDLGHEVLERDRAARDGADGAGEQDLIALKPRDGGAKAWATGTGTMGAVGDLAEHDEAALTGVGM